MRDKASEVHKIGGEVQDLTTSPLYELRQQKGYSPVIGEGNLDAAIMFVGEAPGEQEAKAGRPFVGNAGKILNELLGSIGLERTDVYITNIVKDRPPQNRAPTVKEIRLYAPFLVRQIDIIRPSVLAPLGRFALEFLLNEFDAAEKGRKIGELHGRVLTARAPFGEVAIVPLYHPASAFYNQSLEATLREDFQVLKQFA